ncbi:MAG: ABC transporter ATP-binding protein [Kiloniellales bacterium]
MADKILEVRGLSVDAVGRRGGVTPILQDVSFTVAPGEVISLIGESGSGKTTVSLAVMAYARPGCRITGGEVILDGRDMLKLDARARQRVRGTDISYIAQSAAAAFNAALTIGRQVIEVPVIKGLMSRAEAEARAVELYRQLDLPNPETIGRLYPHQVSGGQLQRVMAAMAMICDPKLLILDEPTTALDVTTQIEVLEAFKGLIRQKGTAAIYVSHDLAVVAQIADHILVLKDGLMVEHNTTERIIAAPQADYTRTLMAAVKVLPKTVEERARAPNAETPLLEVRNVTAGYGLRSESIVLRNVSLSVWSGETVGIIGESGSGKSTTARVISGLMRPVEGEVLLDGKPLAGQVIDRPRVETRKIQFAFQMADTALNPRHRVRDILGRPLSFYHGMEGRAARQRVAELLELVEMPAAFAWRFPHELSGGQKQRVNLARALAAEPDLIICDEITSALDSVVAAAIIQLLKDLRDRLKVAYIFISHDLSTVANFADRIAVMRLGEVVDYGTTAEILNPPHHEYTELLLSSVPDLRTDWLDEISERRRRAAQ